MSYLNYLCFLDFFLRFLPGNNFRDSRNQIFFNASVVINYTINTDIIFILKHIKTYCYMWRGKVLSCSELYRSRRFFIFLRSCEVTGVDGMCFK